MCYVCDPGSAGVAVIVELAMASMMKTTMMTKTMTIMIMML